MFTEYHKSPDLLAMALYPLFEPYEDATDAVRHNMAVDIITELCGKKITKEDSMGRIRNQTRILDVKHQLAKHMAQQILMYARRAE